MKRKKSKNIHNIIKSIMNQLLSKTNLKIFAGVCFLLASSIVPIIHYFTKKPKYKYIHPKAIGYLNVLKINYVNLFEKMKYNQCLYNKIYSIPTGITNFGVNCYINVLLQVNYIFLS